MKTYLIITSLVLFACNSQVTTEHHEKEDSKMHDHSSAPAEVIGDKKWKADEPTKANVAALVAVINNKSFDESKRKELAKTLQTNVDNLVSQCRMKGPAHDALHSWLEKVVSGISQLKNEEAEFQAAYSGLKTNIESFYVLFE